MLVRNQDITFKFLELVIVMLILLAITCNYAVAAVTPQIAAGSNHTLALMADGTVKSWGDNASGQLGNGNRGGYSSTPVTVTGLGGTVIAVAAGEDLLGNKIVNEHELPVSNASDNNHDANTMADAIKAVAAIMDTNN